MCHGGAKRVLVLHLNSLGKILCACGSLVWCIPVHLPDRAPSNMNCPPEPCPPQILLGSCSVFALTSSSAFWAPAQRIFTLQLITVNLSLRLSLPVSSAVPKHTICPATSNNFLFFFISFDRHYIYVYTHSTILFFCDRE